jgi:hypothetical protein
MPSRIDEVVTHIRGLGFDFHVVSVGLDVWLLRAFKPHMPFISTEERMTSASLIARYAHVPGESQRVPEPTEQEPRWPRQLTVSSIEREATRRAHTDPNRRGDPHL